VAEGGLARADKAAVVEGAEVAVVMWWWCGDGGD